MVLAVADGAAAVVVLGENKCEGLGLLRLNVFKAEKRDAGGGVTADPSCFLFVLTPKDDFGVADVTVIAAGDPDTATSFLWLGLVLLL